jgi:hypothetical protein
MVKKAKKDDKKEFVRLMDEYMKALFNMDKINALRYFEKLGLHYYEFMPFMVDTDAVLSDDEKLKINELNFKYNEVVKELESMGIPKQISYKNAKIRQMSGENDMLINILDVLNDSKLLFNKYNNLE